MRQKPEVQQASEVAYLVNEKGATLEEYKTLKVLRYEMANGKPALKVYQGKSAKPVANYYYRNEEKREKVVSEYKAGADRMEVWRAERKAARKAVSNEAVEVGTVFHSSWGYDQTNNDFYEVVGKVGKSSVVLREIASAHAGGESFMSCQVKPVPGAYCSEPFTKRLGPGNTLHFASYKSAWVWDRETTYESWYA